MAAVEAIQFLEYEVAGHVAPLRLVPREANSATFRTGPSLSGRRTARAKSRQRRRQSLVAMALVAGLAILSWPGHAFGGTTGAGLPTDLADSSVLASGMQYIVQPNDSLRSIAILMNPVDPAAALVRLVHELGSTVVVPGEHILIP